MGTEISIPQGLTKYLKQQIVYATSDQSVTNSNTLTASNQCVLSVEAGTYEYESFAPTVASDWANSGVKSTLNTTGTVVGNSFGVIEFRSISADTFTNMALFRNNNNSHDTEQVSPASSLWLEKQGTVTFTTAGTIFIVFAQDTAVAAQTATLQAGAFLKMTRIA